jgi:hypothetical protein
MRKLAILLLIALLLTASAALAQEQQKKIVSSGSPTPQEPGTTTPPATAGTPSTGTTPVAATAKIYLYAGTGNQVAASNVPLTDADLPPGWTKDDWAKRELIRAYNVQPDAVDIVLDGIKQYNKPVAIFDGNIVFLNEDTGSKTIVSGKDTFEYDKDGKLVNADKLTPEQQKKADEVYERGYSQFGSFANILGTFTQYYRQYSGLAGWSSLIFDEEFLADWRNTVNTIMCDKLHLPTKDCWTSKICAKYTDIKPTRNGILYTAPVGGAPRAIAHVEGVRSTPIVLPNQTSWVYTVTFGLTNPTDETMSYNVRFSGPNRAVTWWPEAQTIGKGGTAAALGAESLIKMSVHDYSQVCLEFNPSITAFGGKKLSSICNSIVQQDPTATAPYQVAVANETSAEAGAGAQSPASPSAPGGNV